MGRPVGDAWASQSIGIGSITVPWTTVKREVGSMVFGNGQNVHARRRLNGNRACVVELTLKIASIRRKMPIPDCLNTSFRCMYPVTATRPRTLL